MAGTGDVAPNFCEFLDDFLNQNRNTMRYNEISDVFKVASDVHILFFVFNKSLKDGDPT